MQTGFDMHGNAGLVFILQAALNLLKKCLLAPLTQYSSGRGPAAPPMKACLHDYFNLHGNPGPTFSWLEVLLLLFLLSSSSSILLSSLPFPSFLPFSGLAPLASCRKRGLYPPVLCRWARRLSCWLAVQRSLCARASLLLRLALARQTPLVLR